MPTLLRFQMEGLQTGFHLESGGRDFRRRFCLGAPTRAICSNHLIRDFLDLGQLELQLDTQGNHAERSSFWVQEAKDRMRSRQSGNSNNHDTVGKLRTLSILDPRSIRQNTVPAYIPPACLHVARTGCHFDEFGCIPRQLAQG